MPAEPVGTFGLGDDWLVERVKVHTGGNSWNEDPRVSMNLVNGLLIVTQSKSVHAEINPFLNLLRRHR